MEWSIDTYIQDNPDKLGIDDLIRIQELIGIRNQVFFPDYEQYAYMPQEAVISQTGNDGLNYLKLGLISVSANRILLVGYIWDSKVPINKREGIFSGSIGILNEKYGWDNLIHIEILAMKRFNIELGKNYGNLGSYPGCFEEKSMACLKQIKYNFDTYARDIISGENWDRNAWTDPR